MKPKAALRVRVDESGRLVLPPETTRRYGLSPGAEVYLDERSDFLAVHPGAMHLAKVYIEPTNQCNLGCRTCIRHSWDESLGHMTGETFNRIVGGLRFFNPAPTVFFGGFGEPLAHPGIVGMVSRTKALGGRVELITNGTLLSPKMSTELVQAGLDALWVSLDGATPESYTDVRLGAALPEVVSNLRALVAIRDEFYFHPLGNKPLRPEIGIVFVAMKRNIAELPSMISLGTGIGATLFMVTNVLPYTPDMRDEALYERSLTDRAFMPVSSGSIALPKIDFNRHTLEALRAMPGGLAMTIGGADCAESFDRCPFIAKGATAIAWDGSLVPCLPLLHNHTSFLNRQERVSRRHVIGNVIERNLDDLWRDPDYTAFRDRIQRFDFSPCAYCGGCDLSGDNDKDCAGNTFPTCGGCLWAQGIIQCP